MDKLLDPMGVVARESRDSDVNPLSTAIILGMDVTGSMSPVLEAVARTSLPKLAEEIYSRKPVTDPALMFMGIGDVEAGDRAPLQVTQFESSVKPIGEQLQKIYLEGGGGGNRSESYILPWLFAANHTKIDCFEKRGKRGYLFTFGDEEPTPHLLAAEIERVLGYRPQQAKFTAQELLTMVSRQYEVFHIMIAEGRHYQAYGARVKAAWTNLLGQRAIELTDYHKLGEVIVSAIQINEGASADDVIASWDGSTAMVVRDAVANLKAGDKSDNGLVKFA